MDSPVPLYPTDFPPSYETVMGLRGDSQVGVTASRVGVDGRVGGGGGSPSPLPPSGGGGLPVLLAEPPALQATLFDSQLTDGSHGCTCDRVPSIVLSGEGEKGGMGGDGGDGDRDGDRAGPGDRDGDRGQVGWGQGMARVGPGDGRDGDRAGDRGQELS